MLAFAFDDLRESMESETKSSVGDKHETARAKMQSEQQGLHWQIEEVQGQLKELDRLDDQMQFHSAAFGALVQTNKGLFYITVPLGKVELESTNVYVISQVSPLGKVLLGQKKGKNFTFNSQVYEILDIY
jgi:transcription elongation GreA/GreB family factor